MSELSGRDAITNYYGAQFDMAMEPCMAEFRGGVDSAFRTADNRLMEMAQRILSREWLSKDIVTMLTTMTDDVLAEAGLLKNGEQPAQVVIFRAELPPRLKRGYDLKIFSIADGIAGFNTLSYGQLGEDNSRRWDITIDRGTHFGAAFDGKGVVYQHGRFEPSHYAHRQNIQTGSITELIRDFHDNHIGPITFELCPELGTKVQTTAA